MKIFIFFSAMLVVLTGFFSYTSDMARYMYLQTGLKALSEEAASGAALFVDENNFSEGKTVLDKNAAESYTKFLIKKSALRPYAFVGEIKADVVLFDDEKGYGKLCDYGLSKEMPTAIVSLEFESEKDLFRLPFLSAKKIKRTSVYQWDDGSKEK